MGACFALGEIGRSGSLILPDGSEDGAGSGGNTVLSKLDLVKKFIGKVQSTKDNSKVRQKLPLVCCFHVFAYLIKYMFITSLYRF